MKLTGALEMLVEIENWLKKEEYPTSEYISQFTILAILEALDDLGLLKKDAIADPKDADIK